MAAGTSAAHILLKNANCPQFYSKNGSNKFVHIWTDLCIFCPEYPEFSINFWRMLGSGKNLWLGKIVVWGNLKMFFFENLLLAGELLNIASLNVLLAGEMLKIASLNVLLAGEVLKIASLDVLLAREMLKTVSLDVLLAGEMLK